jgi:hypothetical protein
MHLALARVQFEHLGPDLLDPVRTIWSSAVPAA